VAAAWSSAPSIAEKRRVALELGGAVALGQRAVDRRPDGEEPVERPGRRVVGAEVLERADRLDEGLVRQEHLLVEVAVEDLPPGRLDPGGQLLGQPCLARSGARPAGARPGGSRRRPPPTRRRGWASSSRRPTNGEPVAVAAVGAFGAAAAGWPGPGAGGGRGRVGGGGRGPAPIGSGSSPASNVDSSRARVGVGSRPTSSARTVRSSW